MKNLLLSNFIICFLISCSVDRHMVNYASSEQPVLHSYFDSSHATAKYKATMSIFGKNLTGILYVKFTNDTTCHTAFITIPGVKLFEVQLTPNHYYVKDCISQLNKPGVLSTIEKNIRIFTFVDNFEEKYSTLKADYYNGIIVRKFSSRGVYNFYQNSNNQINQIEFLTNKLKRKIIVTATDFQGTIPSTIHIINKKINLSIHLSQL